MSQRERWGTFRAERSARNGLGLRLGLAVVVLMTLFLLFHDRLSALDLPEVTERVGRISGLQWLAAALATAGSFWALARYDRVAHAVLGTGVGARQAGRAGVAAIALGQAVGLGVIASALVRWRMLPQLTLWQVTRVSIWVAVTFLAALAVISAFLVLVAGYPEGWRPLAMIVLAVAGLMVPMALFPPTGLAVPPLRAGVVVLALVVIDCAGTTLALAVLLPPEHLPDVPLLAAVVVLAMGAGLVTGTPGGLGPFEVTLLALLPMVPAESMMAAVVGFRLVYHVLPAAIAGLWVLLVAPDAPDGRPRDGAQVPDESRLLHRRLAAARRAEAALVATTGLALHADAAPGATLARTGSCLVGLGDPWLPMADVAPRLAAAAADSFLVPVLYKIGADTAARARRDGWQVIRIADEAWLDPRSFADDVPARRQLRRRLRKAEAAGVTVTRIAGQPPLDGLAEVNAAWNAAHGPERGFSMGRFPGASVTHGTIFAAWHGECLVAFVSFHSAWGEWTLDLMRYAPEAPEGTMPLLIRRAIEAAAAEGVPRLSLAAVPRLACHLPGPVADWFDTLAGTEGLTRFKAAFAPRWEPLYAAAPGRASLALGLVSIARAVRAGG
jgi:phosphatidylglycerol lysyltransferase